MKLYFAGKSTEWLMIRDWVEGAKSQGHQVTFDWTYAVEKYGRGEQGQVPEEVMIHAALDDLSGAMEADVLVLFPVEGIYGAMLETGAALACGKQVWVVGEVPRFSIFFLHPLVTKMTFEELRKRLQDGSA